jgi:intracellular sulfur oxidation DsrE/DsrF family protein
MIKKIFISLAIIFSSTFSLVSTNLMADTSVDQACHGLSALDSSISNCGNSNSSAPTKVDTLIQNVTNLISYSVGAVAVIVIIYAGFRFITAGGDQNTISSARNMILYASVGIAVAVSAQLIVHYAINTANG